MSYVGLHIGAGSQQMMLVGSGGDGGSAPPPDPDPSVDLTSLYTGGAIGAAFSAANISALFQDDAGATAVSAAGQPVGLIQKVAGNDDNATMATSASRPTYQTDGNSRGYLDFDGIDDSLRFSDEDLSGDSFSLFIAMNMPSSDTLSFVWTDQPGGHWILSLNQGSSQNTNGTAGNRVDGMYVDGVLQSPLATLGDLWTYSTGSLKPVLYNMTGTSFNPSASGWHLSGWPGVKMQAAIYAFGWRTPAITDTADIELINQWLKQEAGL